jgi:hypothetical protein
MQWPGKSLDHLAVHCFAGLRKAPVRATNQKKIPTGLGLGFHILVELAGFEPQGKPSQARLLRDSCETGANH